MASGLGLRGSLDSSFSFCILEEVKAVIFNAGTSPGTKWYKQY